MGIGKTSRLSADRFRLTSFWDIDYDYTTRAGRKKDALQGSGLPIPKIYGIACGQALRAGNSDHALALRDIEHALVGEDCREILKDNDFATTWTGQP